jgi:hypothetical protein
MAVAALNETVRVMVKHSFEDRGDQASYDFLSYPTSNRGNAERSKFSFPFGNISHIEGVFRNQGFSRKRKGRSDSILTPGLTTPVQPVTFASLIWVCPFGPPDGRPPPDTLWSPESKSWR